MQKRFLTSWNKLALLLFVFICPHLPGGTTSVWKVTDAKGDTLYLGGSCHSLRQSDYPLPVAFDNALAASSRLAFEIDDKVDFGSSLVKAGEYPRGDQLKNHVDPRTYEYLRKVLARSKLGPDLISRFRPWFISFLLEAPGADNFSTNLGVETYLTRKAHGKKAITGLESTSAHLRVFSGLSEKESEACLLLSFINLDRESAESSQILAAWRRGDTETVWRMVHDGYRDFPGMGHRLLGARNQSWIPKIEGYLRSGKIYFVVAGAAHMGGPDGVLALLKGRGYKIEQL
jgi:uncharacterized protein YbaP (TraB family)